ncbi:MAG: hypothetical protein L6Q59_05835 [Ignavibacteriaceae bacterium]|nr:hypothetical protein [Ignavibacteriaceae bacterium]
MSGVENLFIGRAGHLYVMSELLIRGWNTAIPEVDIGDDIFVVKDSDGELKKVQVKTASLKSGKSIKSCQFKISLKQLRLSAPVSLYYIFVMRDDDVWMKPLIVKQDYLLDYYQSFRLGSVYKDSLTLRFSIKDQKITSSDIELTKYWGFIRIFQF